MKKEGPKAQEVKQAVQGHTGPPTAVGGDPGSPASKAQVFAVSFFLSTMGCARARMVEEALSLHGVFSVLSVEKI